MISSSIVARREQQWAQNGSDDDLLADDDELLSDDDLLPNEDELLADDDELPSDDDLLLDEDELLADDDELPSDDDLLLDEDEPLADDSLLADEEGLLADEEGLEAEDDSGEEVYTQEQADEDHAALFVDDIYPSANACATCHPKQYDEWSVSQHAYAQLSPVFMAMQNTINMKTSGTNGDFCIRCHNQVGMNLGESVYISNLERPATSREGITCVVCHRLSLPYGKESGRFALEEGDLFEPIYGPSGGEELERVLSRPDEYRVVTDREAAGRGIHNEATRFFQLVKPSFCGSCHDVTLLNGFRLEEAFAEYKRSPAAAKGVTCQDCHMGLVQGIPSNYDYGPAAVVGDVPTRNRRLTSHFFAGPDYSIIHPGLFPHNVRAAEFKTLDQWLQFDHEAGWGTDEFEDSVQDDYEFPDAWLSIDDRYDGRAIIEEQLERLDWAKSKREEVLRNGYAIGDINVRRADEDGIAFDIEVRNQTDGHGVPTGFDAERLAFLEVRITDSDGNLVYVSGDRDPNGDVRDSHSLYVHNGELPLDDDLFNLQSKFIVRLFRGGEREQVLAVNESLAALPFVRPETRATTIYGRPFGVRKHKQTLEPLGVRVASYEVDGDQLSGPGVYHLSVRLISQMVPVNLVAAIQSGGFDYGMTPKEVAEGVVKGATVVAEKEVTIDTASGEPDS